MSKMERTAWVSLIVEGGVALYYFSAIFAMGPDVSLHSGVMAILIGKVIMLAIILGIVMEVIMAGIIRRERDKVPQDERDSLISAKSYRNGYFVLAVGCASIIGYVVLSASGGRAWWITEILDLTPVYAAHLLLLSMMLSSGVINASRIFYYRRGY